MSESSAIESTGIVAKPLTVGGGPTEENVVIRYDCHVLLQCCVAAIWQKLGALVLDVVSRDTQAGSVIKKKNILFWDTHGFQQTFTYNILSTNRLELAKNMLNDFTSNGTKSTNIDVYNNEYLNASG